MLSLILGEHLRPLLGLQGPFTSAMGDRLVEIEGRWQVRLNRAIGEGGFGAVFRAKDLQGTPPCDSAAKRVSLAETADKEAYEAELGVLKKVHDIESVIGLQGSAEVGDYGWMFLEMATGGELFDRLIDSSSLSERTRTTASAAAHALVAPYPSHLGRRRHASLCPRARALLRRTLPPEFMFMFVNPVHHATHPIARHPCRCRVALRDCAHRRSARVPLARRCPP